MFQVSLKEYLFAYTALTAEVDEKIYPYGDTPTGTLRPYITWQYIDNAHVHHQTAASGLANPRLQVDVWADRQYDAARILDIVRIALDKFRGPMGDAPDQTEVRLIAIDTDNERYRPLDDGTQQGARRASADFLVWFVEET